MKQTTLSTTFVSQHTDWLSQFESLTLFTKLLDLADPLGVYIVDSKQTILFWSAKLANYSGLVHQDVVGKTCLPALQILDAISEEERIITLTRADGSNINLIRNTTVLWDKLGAFAGGIGLVREPLKSAEAVQPAQPAYAASAQNFHGIISRSPAMRDVFQIIQNAAETEATVLVRGESGSGKELVAKAIHALSARRNAPFLAINCAALSNNLLESELFGHVRGAFTGAIKDHSGLFQRAQGGTLFLDEIAELPLELQAKLLRVLQERNYLPVGGHQSVDVDVRIVAATHRSLREEVKNGHFREDLMYRLRVVPLFLPPLRERREDIGLLIWHFISQHNDKRVRVIEKIDPDAMKVLLDYHWPGNIRELHNVVEYAFAVGRGATLRLIELPPEFREPRLEIAQTPNKPPDYLSPEAEMAAILHALEQSQGHVNQAASLLGMSRATFWRKRKHYKI